MFLALNELVIKVSIPKLYLSVCKTPPPPNATCDHRTFFVTCQVTLGCQQNVANTRFWFVYGDAMLSDSAETTVFWLDFIFSNTYGFFQLQVTFFGIGPDRHWFHTYCRKKGKVTGFGARNPFLVKGRCFRLFRVRLFHLEWSALTSESAVW